MPDLDQPIMVGTAFGGGRMFSLRRSDGHHFSVRSSELRNAPSRVTISAGCRTWYSFASAKRAYEDGRHPYRPYMSAAQSIELDRESLVLLARLEHQWDIHRSQQGADYEKDQSIEDVSKGRSAAQTWHDQAQEIIDAFVHEEELEAQTRAASQT